MVVMWTFAGVFLLLAKAWSDNQGPNQITAMTPAMSPPVKYESRNLYFNHGSDINLTCSSKTWHETLYVTWNITFKDCIISFDNGGQSVDSCRDGKSLRNTSDYQPYLHIHNFSRKDEGLYRCEAPYRGGSTIVFINVTATVPPRVSMKLEDKGSKTVAVCRAEGGKPAANISWNHTKNSSSPDPFFSDGGFTVEIRLDVPEGTDPKTLKCAVRHPCWKGERTLVPEQRNGDHDGHVFWLYVVIVVVIALSLTGFVLFALKKLRPLRYCKQSDPSSSKSPPTEDVEEVEPYASYVQRVNSIYNSSADLFR